MKKSSVLGNIFCKELDINIKGFLSEEQLKIIRENSYQGQVLQGMEYRPDKIAAYYLGDETMGWLISAANNFQNGIRDYHLGRSLKIPNDAVLIKLSSK